MTGKLASGANLADADTFYEKLIALHDGLGAAESRLVNAKLILLLANHIGDAKVLDEALAAARAELRSTGHAGAPDQAPDAGKRQR